MASKNHYDALEVASTAGADEIKRAFRIQIARYHPDKVQHLGKEFQEMAADRAAELTEAYRVLSNSFQRAEYDRVLALSGTAAPAQPPGSAPVAAGDPPPAEDAPLPRGEYTRERASRDQFVRQATIDRIRQMLATMGSDYSESEARGFDIALVPKPKLFGVGKHPRLLGRFIDPVDAAAVAHAWPLAVRWLPSSKDDVCVFLLGSRVAPARELAEAIADERRRNRVAKVTMIPIDVRTWEAHIPLDTPGVCKDLLAKLKKSS